MGQVHIFSAPRCTISEMYGQGQSQVQVAMALGRDKSVICRERKRNRQGAWAVHCAAPPGGPVVARADRGPL